jgi:hypothetical protein
MIGFVSIDQNNIDHHFPVLKIQFNLINEFENDLNYFGLSQ